MKWMRETLIFEMRIHFNMRDPNKPLDPRYQLIKVMWEKDFIKSLDDIFKYIPQTVVAVDLGIKKNRWNEMFDDPRQFLIKHLFNMAEMFELEPIVFMMLIVDKVMANRAMKTSA